ncbi:MAG: L-serine ammonia-lyase [Sphaerochaetaceae bacterium]|nr:L-serine ammonia-lyase [Sphaerochaetaceae bacterium]
MESLRELYRYGHGPSSSHTMGPRKAAKDFFARYPDADRYECTLFGSLAATGRGHLTDDAIYSVFKDRKLDIFWEPGIIKPKHPNALEFRSYDKNGNKTGEETYYSVGGGKIQTESDFGSKAKEVYPSLLSHMNKILRYCDREGCQIWELAIKYEGEEILDYMEEIWTIMEKAVKRGLLAEGVLKGGLKLPRKACQYYTQAQDFSGPLGYTAKAISYALAVSEENAAGGKIVTAPTCGSCGVVPGVLYYLQETYKIPRVKMLRALLTAGIVGNVCKHNGSISGAEVGCQGEVGVACAMASAGAAYLLGGSIYQIEYAAEMGLEHHLGLTCDPMLGLVQIPCIERNAMATMRALNHATYALLSDGRHRVSLDNVITVMMETGEALPYIFKETSQGGLATVKDS